MLDPGVEPGVQLVQPGHHLAAGGGLAAGADLDQELPSHGLEPAFDFSPPLGPVGRAVDQADAQLRAVAGQRLIREAGPVIDIQPGRDAADRDRPLQRLGQVQAVLAEPPPEPGDQPRMVVYEREQVGLPARHMGAVQDIAGPQQVGGLGLEPAVHHPAPGRGDLLPHEVPLQGPLRRRPSAVRGDDPGHLRRGPLRILLLQRRRQLQHAGLRPR